MKTREIAEFLSGELVGDGEIEITAVASIATAGGSEIAFITNAEYSKPMGAGCLLVPPEYYASSGDVFIRVGNPKLAFARLATVLHPLLPPARHQDNSGVKTNASNRNYFGEFVSVPGDAIIGDACQLHSGTRVGRNVAIGDRTIIYPNCVIYGNVVIGSDCIIHSGTVIGSPGFGYVADENGEHINFPQIGSVVIEDLVEIGANCTIDRGALGETRIGAGTKIDNLVQIAHNVQIGKRVIIAAQSGIAGSSIVEDDVVIAGQVGIADHVRIRAGAVIGAKSSVFPNKILAKGVWSGIPVQPVDAYRRQHAHLKGISRLKDEIRALREQVDELMAESKR
jgi:UDP-3-O-[3-hydroxymyristoyl] glucosamine N-acyltransferase